MWALLFLQLHKSIQIKQKNLRPTDIDFLFLRIHTQFL